jgi:glycerophosphoryl diester phosphodiesterase
MRYYIPDNILSIAHRGYSSKYKDNSWSAFKNVKKKGFDMIEIDIQLCKSGEIIIYHDTFLKNKQISTLTLAEIKKKKKSIITLQEFFEYFDSNIQPVYLDMKGGEELAHRLFCFLKTYAINLTNIICCSFNKRHIDYLKLKIPELKVGFITSNILNTEDLENYTKNIDALIIEWNMLDNDTIKFCRQKEISVYTYTMKGIDSFNYIKNFNVDGIISNYRLFGSKNYYISPF